MGWHGVAPEEIERAEQLPPGAHRVKLTGWRELDSGKFIVTLSNRTGEVAEFLPNDIAPMSKEEREAYKDKHGFYHDGWKAWRIFGAFDHPTADYWRKPAGEREAMTWDVAKVLDSILKSGVEAWVRTTIWVDKKNRAKAQIDNAKSLVRHSEELANCLPPPGGSIIDPPQPVEPVESKWGGGAGANTEVPFHPGKWWR